jgi:hypothetical protein
MRTELASHRDLITSQGRRISSLEAQVQVLKGTSEGYLEIRQGFLDTFRRDILKIECAQTITVGNEAAHDGDAVADAGLFESGCGNDHSLMFKIYGLSARQVLSLSKYLPPPIGTCVLMQCAGQAGDYDSISLINACATLQSDKERSVPQDIEEA